jgi:hypothetical protein
MLYLVHLTMNGVLTHNLVVIGTDCIGCCKSNYHMIMTVMRHYGERAKTKLGIRKMWD